MCKKLVCLITLCLLVVITGSSQAADKRWDNGGSGKLWSTSGNWNPDGVPGSSDNVYIEEPYAYDPNGPIIQNGINAECDMLVVAYWDGPITLTMTGGTLNSYSYTVIGYTDRVESDANGFIDISGGTIDTHAWLYWVKSSIAPRCPLESPWSDRSNTATA